MGGGCTLPRFFIEPTSASVGEHIALSGEDANHISLSLRAKPGEEYILCDTCNYEYKCKIVSISSDEVVFEILDKKPSESEPDVKVTLFQALIKGDKFDAVVQKAVELGVCRIVPVISERCVSRPDPKQLQKKIERWQKISKSAAMQCGRSYVPEICQAVDYKTSLEMISEADCGFVCYEAQPHQPMKHIFEKASIQKKSETYSFFVGPEGGISDAEANLAESKNIPLASLGKRVLRTETAPVCVISAIMYHSDNLN